MANFNSGKKIMRYGLVCLLGVLGIVKAQAQGAGRAVSFPATSANEHINLGTGLSGALATSSFTVEMWINFAALNSDEPIIGNKNWNSGANIGWVLTRSSKQSATSTYIPSPIPANTLWFNITPNGGTRRDWHITLPGLNMVNKWNHVAISVDRTGSVAFYINGVPATIAAYAQNGTNSWTTITTNIAADSNKSLNGTLPVRLGQDGTGTYSPRYNGKVDEVRIWNTVRTQAQIRDNMCHKLGGTETGLLAYYRLDEATGTTAVNAAATGTTYDGTLTNSPARIASAAPLGDTSVNIYPASFTGQALTLASAANGSMTVQNISGGAKGMHLYRIDAAPNTYGTIPNPNGNSVYYGIFPADTNTAASTYGMKYDYTGFPAANTYEQGIDLFKRMNADSAWNAASAAKNTVSNLLSIATDSNRNELIIGNFMNPATCNTPSALSATGVTHNSAVLNWTSGGSNRWNIEYGAGNFTLGTGTRISNNATNPYTLSNLAAATSYKFYVQDTCASINSSSAWAGPYSFTTLPDYSRYGSGYALNFPGTGANEHVNLGTALSAAIDTQNFSIETWINFAQFNDDETFISNKNWNNGANIGFAFARSNKSGFPDNTFWFNMQTTGGARRDWHVTIPGLNLVKNWNHVAVTVDRKGNIAFYINGMPAKVVGYAQNGSNSWTTVNMNIAADSNKSLKGTLPVRLGQDGTGTYGVKFKGQMDEVRVWNTVRTQAEIRDYMCRKLKGNENGLLAYYRLDEPAGTMANNNATANAASYTGTLQNNPQHIISGAAIGDTSVYVYSNNLSNTAVQIGSLQNGKLTVDSFKNSYAAVQLYRIDTIPNTVFDMASIGTNKTYFGVFPVDTAGAGNSNFVQPDASYRISYDYSNYPNAVSNAANLHLYNRRQNDVLLWTDLGAANQVANNKMLATAQRMRKELMLADFSAANCSNVTNLHADSITNNYARIVWNSAGNKWNLQYGAQGFTPGLGTIDTVTTNPKDGLTNLAAGTWYDVYVRNRCSTDSSKWVGPYTFRTADPCPAPVAVQVVYLGGDSVKISWPNNGAAVWNLQWGPAGFQFGNGIPVDGITTTSYVLNGLSNTQTYEVYLQDTCTGSGKSKWFGPVSFGANGPIVGIAAVNSNNLFSVSPNPAQSFIDITTSITGRKDIRLLNMQGVLVQQSATYEQQHRMHLENLPAGMYLLKCSNGQAQQTFKLIISK